MKKIPLKNIPNGKMMDSFQTLMQQDVKDLSPENKN